MLIHEAFVRVQHIQNLSFSHKNSMESSYFFDASFWTLLFHVLVRLDAKMPDLGSPLAPNGAPHETQNRPNGAKNPPKKHKMVAPFRRLASEAASERSWAPFWLILDGFVL